jgi:hypothetical protein
MVCDLNELFKSIGGIAQMERVTMIGGRRPGRLLVGETGPRYLWSMIGAMRFKISHLAHVTGQ